MYIEVKENLFHDGEVRRHVHKTGFTLIEIGIVLIVISLLVGGVLVGRDLIYAARIRNTVKQVEELDAAVNIFLTRYNCLPGDCSRASRFNFTAFDGGAIDGNGDGKIAASAGEYYNAIRHLGEAQLLKVADRYFSDAGRNIAALEPTIPATSYANRPGVWLIAYLYAQAGTLVLKSGHYYWITTNLSGDADVPTLLPKDAFSIDSKLDDGFPLRGIMMGSGNGMGDATTGPYLEPTDIGPSGATSNFCITNDSPNQYNVQNSGHQAGSLCAIAIKAGF